MKNKFDDQIDCLKTYLMIKVTNKRDIYESNRNFNIFKNEYMNILSLYVINLDAVNFFTNLSFIFLTKLNIQLYLMYMSEILRDKNGNLLFFFIQNCFDSLGPICDGPKLTLTLDFTSFYINPKPCFSLF
jgi:hypothetical protein